MKNTETPDTEVILPPVLWAQSKVWIFLKFEIECAKPEIKILKDRVTFKGIGVPEMKQYEVDFRLFSDVDPEKSTVTNKGRNIEVNLSKIDLQSPFWPYLTEDRTKHHWLKVDFNKWKDEDDTDEVSENLPMGDMFGKNWMEENHTASLASTNYDDDDVYPDKFGEDFPPEFAEDPKTDT